MKNAIIIFGVGLFALSCTGPMYIPESVQVSNLTEKNTVEVNLGGGLTGYELSAAYAITDNIGIQAQGTAIASRSNTDSDFLNRYYTGGGVGFTSFITPEDDSWFFSVFAGGGVGTAEARQTIYTIKFSDSTNSKVNYSKGDYHKIWIQPTLGLINSGPAELFFSARLSYVKFNTLENVFESNVDNLDLINGSRHNIYYEPAVTLRLGNELFKWNFQMGYSIPQFPNSGSQFRARKIILNTGMTFHIGN